MDGREEMPTPPIAFAIVLVLLLFAYGLAVGIVATQTLFQDSIEQEGATQ